jgi:serine/threonine protein kinase/tetratricopeptide (TPR) repeat protein
VEALRERFGKYHVLEKIAQGGMAEVYKVKTVGIAGFEKVQALKRILPHSAREARFIRSFVDEARIAVELTHRNIVQVFDFGKADGELFLAMELIEGRDLRSAMAQSVSRDFPCPIPVAAFIIGEVAAGLDYAHRKSDGYGGPLGIVHCDVSPSNVMLSTDGYVKILDFGIARATFASALERRRLRGKPRYMAPEQTLGEAPTAAADVFALGIIAWELFTGLPLFRGTDLKSILEAVRRMQPPLISKMNPAVPAAIVDAVAVALSREPGARGTSADLATACSRTALAAGARALADWLGELDQRSSTRPAPPEQESTSMSVQKSGSRSGSMPNTTPPPSEPPARPSVTVSLGSVPVPPPDIGEGTPGFADPSEGATTTTTSPNFRFGERERTSSVTTPHRFGDRDPTASTTAVAHQFGHENTAAGVGKLADALPDVFATTRAQTEPVQRISRPSYETIVLAPGARPSALRFDDEATQHGFAAPPVGEVTSYDDLEVDADPAPVVEPAGEEPIDDDLGVEVAGELGERRRSVVIAGMLDGAPPEVLRPIARSLGELAYQRGGVVLELDDDALLVAFGLEVAGEDDVAIAMGWALDAAAMARDAAGTEAGAGGPTLRIGARTGVALGAGGDGGARLPQDATDEARALAREAAPDRPLFVGAAGRVTSSLYALREVPAPKRIARRSKVIEVVGPRGFEERDRARLERRGKFIGRTVQLAELDAWLQRAVVANRRLTVLVQGAAGTGKSRLVAELIARRRIAATPLRVVMTGANPASHHAPFALVIDLYQAALGLVPARGRSARAQLVQRLLHVMQTSGVSTERARAVAGDLDRAMELRDGIGVATPEVADLRPRISAGLAAFRMAKLETEPMLTVIEDLHLADGASLEVLRHTLAVSAPGPELLVLTARSDGPPPPPVDAVIEVGDLVGGELRALISDRLGDAATPLNIAAVLARGGGNPLFVEELADAVREAGDDVPATARDVIAARVDRLSAKAKAALRFAAVLGGMLRARLLEELLGEASLEAELDELVEAGFLVRPESAAHSSEGELTFARGLVREVIYESLSARAQRESHARVGRLLASRFFAGREEPPAVIAEHMERGGEVAGAAAFWLRAGRLALAASDTDTAVVHFSRTLMLERELGAVPPTPTARARRRDALAGREEARRLQGNFTADPSDLDDLQRLAEGDPRRLADVAIRRAQRLLRVGDYAAASVATVVAEDQAAASGDRRLHGEALRVRGEVLERLGRFDEALDAVGAARELFAREGAVAEEMQAMVGRGRIHLMRAHYEAARDAYRPVIARIEKTGDPWLERIVKNHVAVIEMCLGNFATAMTSAQRSLELCRRYGDRAREGDALSVSGIILLEVGLHDQAAAMFGEALQLLARTASRWSRADCLIYAGVCDVRRGRPEGLAMLDEALAEARRLGARYLEANALISRAGARLRRGEAALALGDAAAGATVARGATLVGYEIQGLARHALALVRTGLAGDAGPVVDRALTLLDEQRYLEGSEEEVYASCVEVLRAIGAKDRAAAVLARGKSEAVRKLAMLTDPVWRDAYAANPDTKALLDG